MPSSLAVTVAWNSDGWRRRARQGEGAGFGYVKGGGLAHESWNFDSGNPRNTRQVIRAYLPDIEACTAGVVDLVLTSQPDPRRPERYVIGMFLGAQRVRGRKFVSERKIGPRGERAYTNLDVPREGAFAFPRQRAIRWDLDRYYSKKPKRKRTWPGRSTFLYLEDSRRDLLAEDIEAKARDLMGLRSMGEEERREWRRVVAGARRLAGRSRGLAPPTLLRGGRSLPPGVFVRAERRRIEAERILRDAAEMRKLKEAYDWRCQVDRRHEIELPHGPYAEVHHLVPLAKGGEFSGPTYGNCLVVCPGCHVRFQEGAMCIDPADGRTIRHFNPDHELQGRRIKLRPGHKLYKRVLTQAARLLWRRTDRP